MAKAIKSAIPGIQWPGVPDRITASLVGILYQIEQSQWWPDDRLRELQFEQIRQVVSHASNTVLFYGARFREAGIDPTKKINFDEWSRLPLLTRRDLQSANPPILSSAIPRQHGQSGQILTSGSTGQPVVVWKTELERLFWLAFSIRDHLWHSRDFKQSLATIRYMKSDASPPPNGSVHRYWDKQLAAIFPTGPVFALNIRSSVQEQTAWLRGLDPAYLLTYPSVLAALAEEFGSQSATLENMHHFRTFGEALDDRVRQLCQHVFNVSITDIYSSQEAGYIAIQCPVSGYYHIQSENVFVEILNDKNYPCTPGETGRVVVTTLHNFATPLIRYDIGDFAEVGSACSCGRGLPVLRRILGRERNLMILPNGERRWPGFAEGNVPVNLPPFQQFQLVQKSRDLIEVRVVLPRPWTLPEQVQISEHLRRSLGHSFQFEFRFLDEIPRSPSGKFEEFKCEAS